MDQHLLRRFLELYPFQPATAVWRAPEVAAVAKAPFPGGLGLDLGCGDGRLTRVLANEVGGLKLIGLDVDPLETSLAAAEGFYEQVYTSAGDHIPESDQTFDFVISVSVMEHIPNLEEVLREVARVLKTGGRLIASIPSVGFHQMLRGPMLPWVSRAKYLQVLDRRVAHLRYWSISEWEGALSAAGLRLLDAQPILSKDEIRRWETIARLTSGVLYAFTGGKPPIEIQRSLGMRRPGRRLPGWAAWPLAWLLSRGLRPGYPTDESTSGCLLIIAERA